MFRPCLFAGLFLASALSVAAPAPQCFILTPETGPAVTFSLSLIRQPQPHVVGSDGSGNTISGSYARSENRHYLVTSFVSKSRPVYIDNSISWPVDVLTFDLDRRFSGTYSRYSGPDLSGVYTLFESGIVSRCPKKGIIHGYPSN